MRQYHFQDVVGETLRGFAELFASLRSNAGLSSDAKRLPGLGRALSTVFRSDDNGPLRCKERLPQACKRLLEVLAASSADEPAEILSARSDRVVLSTPNGVILAIRPIWGEPYATGETGMFHGGGTYPVMATPLEGYDVAVDFGRNSEALAADMARLFPYASLDAAVAAQKADTVSYAQNSHP